MGEGGAEGGWEGPLGGLARRVGARKQFVGFLAWLSAQTPYPSGLGSKVKSRA